MGSSFLKELAHSGVNTSIDRHLYLQALNAGRNLNIICLVVSQTLMFGSGSFFFL